MPSSKIRICIVPICGATSEDVPDRIFFPVPEDKKEEWLQIVGGDIKSIISKKRLYCCENHFDLKIDIEGYYFYKVFGGRVKLSKNAYPSKRLGDNNHFVKVEEVSFKQEHNINVSCQSSADPLSITDDRNFEHDGADESSSDNTEFDPPDSDSKFDNCQTALSEEIIVTSDVYMHDDDDDFSDDDDVPLKIRKIEDDCNPNVTVTRDLTDIKHNCTKCGKILSSSKSLKRHIKTMHADDGQECNETLTILDDYKKRNTDFKCMNCDKELASPRSLRKHTQSFHANEDNETENQLERKSDLKTDDESGDKDISCRECHEVFSTRENYLKHKIIHKKTFECDVCQKVFRTRRHLKAHFPTHMTDKPFLCEICPRPFARANNFRRHKLTHIQFTDKKFVCDICGRRFPANYLLRHHKTRSHNDSQRRLKVKCEKTKKKAATDCPDCVITLNSPYRLKLHRLRLHNPENPFMCDTCKQTFTTEILMNQHAMRLHAPENTYIFKCYLCPKKYNQEAALKRHVKLHTDPKKQVTCPLCEKVLGRPNRLKLHLKSLHNPNNPFKCELCQQTFREQNILDNHTIQIHEQTILCQYCNKSYSNQRGLEQHIRRFHTNLSHRNE